MEVILGQNGSQLGFNLSTASLALYKDKTKTQAAQSSCYKCGGSEYQIRRCVSSKTDKTVHQSNCERNFTEPLIKVRKSETKLEIIFSSNDVKTVKDWTLLHTITTITTILR